MTSHSMHYIPRLNQDWWVANANVVALGKFEALLQVLPSEVYKISNRKEG